MLIRADVSLLLICNLGSIPSLARRAFFAIFEEQRVSVLCGKVWQKGVLIRRSREASQTIKCIGGNHEGEGPKEDSLQQSPPQRHDSFGPTAQ